MSDGLFIGYIAGALTFGWFLPWLGKKLKGGEGDG